jgi:cholesterol oxidase
LSIETLSQGIHFARLQEITNPAGRNIYVSRLNFKKRWKFPTLSVHGEENGLVDVATLAHMEKVLKKDARRNYRTRKFSGLGHQDSLIGRNAHLVFEEIDSFLRSETSASSLPDPLDPHLQVLHAEIPTLGPMIGPLDMKGGEIIIPIVAGANPALAQPVLAAFVPVIRCPSDSDKFCVLLTDEPEQDGTLDAQCPGWLMVLPPDSDGWMRLNPSAHNWPLKAEGILMILLYDQLGKLSQMIADTLRRTPTGDEARSLAKKHFPLPRQATEVTHAATAVSAQILRLSSLILKIYTKFCLNTLPLWLIPYGTRLPGCSPVIVLQH